MKPETRMMRPNLSHVPVKIFLYKLVNEKTENYWTEVGSMSVGRYRHGVVPVRSGSCGAALFVAGGYVRSVPEGEETNVKSSSIELILL